MKATDADVLDADAMIAVLLSFQFCPCLHRGCDNDEEAGDGDGWREMVGAMLNFMPCHAACRSVMASSLPSSTGAGARAPPVASISQSGSSPGVKPS